MIYCWQKKKNIDLWTTLDLYLKQFNSIKWTWVKVHTDNVYNKRCDELAVSEYKNGKSTTIQKEELDRVSIGFTLIKSCYVGNCLFNILRCDSLPKLYIVEKDKCELIFYGSLTDCVEKIEKYQSII